MHICYICNEYPPAPHGGIGSFTETLAQALVKRGHRVTVLGGYRGQVKEEEMRQGVRVLRFSLEGPPLLRFALNRERMARKLAGLDAEDPVDIVEGGEVDISNLRQNAPGVKVIRMHGGPHYFALPERPGWLAARKERWAFSVADELCAVSQYVAQETRRVLELGARPIEVIMNPVDIDWFRPSDEEEVEGRIFFAGTITERKGIRQLIAAMPAIVAGMAKTGQDVELEVYGGESIGLRGTPFTDSLRAMLPEGLQDKVKWKGRVSRAELAAAMRQASVCVYPSHMEALPIAWLEGLAAGKAVVASKLGPGPEVIDDGVTGLLCDPRQPEDIAAKLLTVLTDKVLRRRLGVAGRQAVEKRFALPGLVAENETYYERIRRRH